MPIKPDANKTTNDLAAEQFYSQVSESIKLVFDLTSRIDERVKMLVERKNELDEKMNKFIELHQTLTGRVTVLETENTQIKKETNTEIKKEITELQNKIQVLELKYEGINLRTTHHDNRANQIFDYILKVIFMLGGGWLLYKFGWQAPPTP